MMKVPSIGFALLAVLHSADLMAAPPALRWWKKTDGFELETVDTGGHRPAV